MKIHVAESDLEFGGMTQNLSVDGLLLETMLKLPEHSHVSFVLELAGGRLVRPIRIAGEGDVVRVESTPDAGSFRVAIACARPMAEIDLFAQAS